MFSILIQLDSCFISFQQTVNQSHRPSTKAATSYSSSLQKFKNEVPHQVGTAK
jgi:hypothetical protein